uniref:F-box domain-containing protein n=1 Tax=Mycena chlorophos TaxID=658473 RepID=A0ABQ0LNY4_MYCCL|nr:predicted protein [Mycena chlorophos]
MATADSTTPRLPPELEHRIFLSAFQLHPETSTALLRVARRVHAWIEPELYRTMNIRNPAIWEAFIHAAKHKPSIMLAVREVIVMNGTFVDASAMTEIYEAMKHCSRLNGLCIAQDLTSPALLSAVPELPIQRLKLGISRLLLHSGEPRPDPLLAAAAFQNVTHFEVLGRIASPEADPCRQFIAALPALTHLSVARATAFGMNLDSWLATLPRLKVMVLISWKVNYDSLPCRDPRIVATSFSADWYEPVLSYRGGYWARAEEFLERKQRGEASGVACTSSTAIPSL